MSVGSLQESVTVAGAAPLVDVQSSGSSEVVRNEEILALPLNGRNADTFNWGAPIGGPIQGGRITDANFSSGTFGRVTSIAGTPRVLQFGVKYGF